MDRIHLRNLALHCVIGTYSEERDNKQAVLINITLETDLRCAGKSDVLKDTINYHTIQRTISDFVQHSRFQLIESLAEGIAEICLKDQRIQSVTVILDKPEALRFCESVAVEITRPQDSSRSL